MSQGPEAPGWWQASDGAWYPPDTHPDPNHRAQFAAAFSPAPGGADSPAFPGDPGQFRDYPARLTVNRDQKIARWRVFLHGIMLIPHFIVQYVINIVAMVCVVIAWFAILFTGRMPEGLHNFIAMSQRYSHRIVAYLLFMTEQYPPFEFQTTSRDPGDYPPVRVDFDYKPDGRNRLTTFFRYFMVIPHMLVFIVVGLAAYVVAFLHWWAVLFTGRSTTGLGDFLIGVGRWVTRLYAYFLLLTDEYPPFSTG